VTRRCATRACVTTTSPVSGVRLLDGPSRTGLFDAADGWTVTADGGRFFAGLGIDLAALRQGRRPLVRECLDWSERRSHLGGALGAALLDRMFASGLAARERGTRILTITDAGERWLTRWTRTPSRVSRVRSGP
jgi:hypothetical protein